MSDNDKPIVHAPCSKVQQKFLKDESKLIIFGGGSKSCASTLKYTP